MDTFFPQIRKSLWIVALALSPFGPVNAHPGHADPVTISRDTHTYMQKLVPHYLKIQKGLVVGELNDEIKGAAQAIERLAQKGRKKETDRTGIKMYKGVAKAAGFIAAANDVDTARVEFAELSDILLPFFDSWPNHIQEHNLVLYTCKETKQWWLQVNSDAVADPYRGSGVACANLIEKEK